MYYGNVRLIENRLIIGYRVDIYIKVVNYHDDLNNSIVHLYYTYIFPYSPYNSPTKSDIYAYVQLIKKIQSFTYIIQISGIMIKDHDYLIKLILIGSSGVGKTSILTQFADNKFS